MSLSRTTARRLLLPVGVCAALALPAAAGAHHGGSPKDTAWGLGTNNPPAGNIATFGFSATSGVNGENATGLAAFGMRDAALKFTYNAGVVQCLQVSDNVATLVFKIQWTRRPPGATQDAVRMYIEDNGTPADPQHPVDKVVNHLFDSTKAATGLACPDPNAQTTIDLLASRDQITSGDTTVVDN